VPRRTDDAPVVPPIGQHFRQVALRTAVAVAMAASRTVRPMKAAPAWAVLAQAVLAAGSYAIRLQPQVPVPLVSTASASPALAVLVIAVLVIAVLADADRPAPTMARPLARCLLGQNLIPRCPAVQFLVGQSRSSARYPAARGSAARKRAGPGSGSRNPGPCVPGRCPAGRMLAQLPAGRASTPVSTARIPPTAAGVPLSGRRAASTRTAQARRALSQTRPLRATASVASGSWHGSQAEGQRAVASAATTVSPPPQSAERPRRARVKSTRERVRSMDWLLRGRLTTEPAGADMGDPSQMDGRQAHLRQAKSAAVERAPVLRGSDDQLVPRSPQDSQD
jgi:hypothetical protein